MYHPLGETVSRRPWLIVITWVAILGGLLTFAPRPQEISKDGVFTFLPYDSPSRQAERFFREAFPIEEGKTDNQQSQQDPLGSNIVVVVQREDQKSGLTEADRKFVEEQLKPQLELLRETTPEGRGSAEGRDFHELPPGKRRVRSIWTASHPRTGPLLDSDDGRATLVVMELNGEFLDYGNELVISRVEDLLQRVKSDPKLSPPAGLDLAMSGSATVGRDMLTAERESASSTDLWTKVLVIILLLAIYRAPIVAMIPLVTVGVAVTVAIRLLALMAEWGWIGFFAGMNVYVTVVVYGAGVDYCLFLIARFREQLEHGVSYEQAIAKAVGHVGAALAASAGASMFGILMMTFAEFGKFRQAGFAISFGMFIVLLCALTLTPSLLRLLAKWAFWPDVRKEHIQAGEGWIPSPGLLESLRETRWFDRGWEWMAKVIEARPGTIFVTSIALMLPFAAVAVAFHDHLSYGLLTDLPQDVSSVEGARAIQKHFPAGIAGVATVLLHNEEFASPDMPMSHSELAEQTVDGLKPRFKELGLVDVRSEKTPLGLLPHAINHLQKLNLIERKTALTIAHHAFTSTQPPYAEQVIRLDLVFNEDPFARDSIAQLAVAEQAVLDAVPEQFRQQTKLYTLGPTAGIRDLKSVTDRDQVRIDLLVSVAVFVVLVVLLRQPAISLYLILSVIFSYLVTMGVTYMAFWAKSPSTFAGLDWKVPIFTFTLLIALGEDYNILLMARVTEEQRKHGLIPGLLLALTKTGGIISSCGIIMAGTFCSLLSGSLTGMVQLGFALAFGVLLDTFVVRPVLVPAYLLLLYRGRFGALGRWMGAPDHLPPPSILAAATRDEEDPDLETATQNERK
jgi:RND superfamily putative drug exporter